MCDTGFCDDDSAIGWAYHECDTCTPDRDTLRDDHAINQWEIAHDLGEA